MGLLVPDTGLLLWMLVSFGAVLGVLLRWGFPVILRAMEARRTHIADALQAAEDADVRVKLVEERVQQMIDHATHEQGQLLERAHKEAAALLEQAREQAERQADQRLRQAEQHAGELQAKALRQADGQIAHLAVQIASRIIGERLRVDDEQQKLIDRMLSEEVKPLES